jgi:hypothetical protein
MPNLPYIAASAGGGTAGPILLSEYATIGRDTG